MATVAFTILFISITNAQEISKTQYYQTTITPVISETPVNEPTDDFKSRINKKIFGTYVTPKNSPVHPERFTGYHTGIDVEYDDVVKPIPVYSLSSGKVVFSGYVKGYGGVLVVNEQINNKNILVLYGHLKLSSLPKTGTLINQKQQIGILGNAYSVETDGERKHLHLAMIKGDNIDFRGYVFNENELEKWYNPLLFFN